MITADSDFRRLLYVGLDDTDTLETPGTNQLARQIAAKLRERYRTRWIVRHQLLVDPRVPYTSGNGSASMILEPLAVEPIDALARWLIELVAAWSPAGSDPGLCVCENVSRGLVEFGRNCQQRMASQTEARRVAEATGCLLFGLGGNNDGIIGATAAVGLARTGNDGRVIHLGSSPIDFSEIGGVQQATTLKDCGVDFIEPHQSGEVLDTEWIDVGKKLRPNLRDGKVVLFVEPVPVRVGSGAAEKPFENTARNADWQARKLP